VNKTILLFQYGPFFKNQKLYLISRKKTCLPVYFLLSKSNIQKARLILIIITDKAITMKKMRRVINGELTLDDLALGLTFKNSREVLLYSWAFSNKVPMDVAV